MKILTFTFPDDGDIPNHPHWPMIVYQGVIGEGGADAASTFETIFAENGWGDGWRNGIFAFPHYHSNAHEVLGIAQGEATVRFGGRNGRELRVSQGDAVLLPAGTGHQRLRSSADLLVIGAYPPGPRTRPHARQRGTENIDPRQGVKGPETGNGSVRRTGRTIAAALAIPMISDINSRF